MAPWRYAEEKEREISQSSCSHFHQFELPFPSSKLSKLPFSSSELSKLPFPSSKLSKLLCLQLLFPNFHRLLCPQQLPFSSSYQSNFLFSASTKSSIHLFNHFNLIPFFKLISIKLFFLSHQKFFYDSIKFSLHLFNDFNQLDFLCLILTFAFISLPFWLEFFFLWSVTDHWSKRDVQT